MKATSGLSSPSHVVRLPIAMETENEKARDERKHLIFACEFALLPPISDTYMQILFRTHNFRIYTIVTAAIARARRSTGQFQSNKHVKGHSCNCWISMQIMQRGMWETFVSCDCECLVEGGGIPHNCKPMHLIDFSNCISSVNGH